MKQQQSPVPSGRQLTPDLFDYYVARARAERAKAIAEFTGQITAWLARLAHRMAGPGRRARPRGGAGARTAR